MSNPRTERRFSENVRARGRPTYPRPRTPTTTVRSSIFLFSSAAAAAPTPTFIVLLIVVWLRPGFAPFGAPAPRAAPPRDDETTEPLRPRHAPGPIHRPRRRDGGQSFTVEFHGD